MTKRIMAVTVMTLGVTTIAATAGFAVYYNKNHNAQVALHGINEQSRFVVVRVHADSDHPATISATKVYDVKENEGTLENLMAHHPADFTLGPVSQFGRPLLSALTLRASTFAGVSHGSFIELASKTYVAHHPTALGANEHSKSKYAVNTGINGFYLTYSEVVDLYLSKY